MDDHKDRLAAMRAATDQAKEAVGEMAELFGSYHKELVAQGFTRDEAMILVVDMQRQMREIAEDD